MRPTDSAYDRAQGGLVTDFLAALTESGRAVDTHVTGAVTIDGETWTAEEFERLARQWEAAWDGDEDTRTDAVDDVMSAEG